MKTFTAKQLSLFVSIFFSVVLFLLLAINYLLSRQGLLLLIAIPVIFILTYFFVLYLLKRHMHTNSSHMESFADPLHKRKKEIKENTTSVEVDEEKAEVDIWTKTQFKELERLKDLEKYRKEFVGNVSHELKTPIFNIQGYVLTLLEGGIDDPTINKLYLQRTEKSIDRMISIVEDLESITKLESGELKLRFEIFDIVKMVEDVFELDQMLANEFKITLEIKNKKEKPLLVFADKKRIMEVVSNLVLNAIKYGKKKGLVRVSFFDADYKIMVEISDNGIGVDNKDLPRVFERFFRVDKSRSREQGGTGLGLSIVKHIIEAHKQTINVKSKPNAGTTFTFSLDKAKQ